MIALSEESRPRRDSLSARRMSGGVFATDALALALTASADGALLVERTVDGAIISWSNESARAFFGQPLGNRPVLAPLLLGAGDETAVRRLLAALDAAEPSQVECPVARDDGVRWGEWSVSPLALDDGAPARCLVTVRDITDRRRRDQALSIYLRETEQSRADALLQAQQAEALVNELTFAGGQAQQVIQQRSAFLASVSHEIRTPLNGVIGLTGVLLGTGLSAEQREIGNAVRGSAERLLSLLNDVLDFAKMDTGRMQLEAVEFDVHETIEQIVELLAVRPDAGQLRVNTLIAPGVPSVMCGDPGRFGQVLSNLVGNAVKFTSAGQVTVRASVDAMSDADVVLRCEVSDSGIGIAPDALDRLFEPFVQADASTTRRYGGSGLGLAICKDLVHLMGGTIGVRSAPGAGSVFWFTVRLSVSASAPANLVLPTLDDIGSRRAMVIDPNRESRSIFALQLGGLGLVCHGASSLAEATAQLEAASEPYALVFIHHECPDAEPMQAARSIRDHAASPAPAVIVLAPLGASPPQAALDAAGVVGIVHTPVRPSLLAGLITSAWRKHRAGGVPGLMAVEIEADDAAPRWRQAPRVLVAEDNIINQQVARHLLQLLGCSVDLVADGLEALDALSNVPYDLVFMDCMMPECDGYEATRRLRAAGTARAGVPVVAMTANVMPGDRQRCLDSGMDDYVSKPVHATDIDAVLRRFLAGLLDDSDETDGARVATAPRVVGPAEAPAPPVTGELVLDYKIVGSLKALQARGARQTLIGDLLAVFRVQAEEISDHLRTALDEADLERVRELAHKFKGSCGSIGAARLSTRAREAERAAREGRLADASAACAGLCALLHGDVLALDAAYRDAIH